MKPLSMRDVIGPIMVGPSSSHTAGALRIASMVRNLLVDEPAEVTFILYGSFAHTYRGHGTDRALVAGILGLHTDDLRVRESFELAHAAGLTFSFEPDPDTKTAHPNTVEIRVVDRSDNEVRARGVSIGGGAAELVRIDGIDVHVTGEFNSMIVRQRDVPGTLAHIAGTLGDAGINIGTSAMHRTRPGGEAFTVLDIDDFVPEGVIERILAFPAVESVRFIPADGLHRAPRDVAPEVDPDQALEAFRDVDFASAADVLAYCDAQGVSIGQAAEVRERALLASRGVPASSMEGYLSRALEVMRDSITKPTDRPSASMGGLLGGGDGGERGGRAFGWLAAHVLFRCGERAVEHAGPGVRPHRRPGRGALSKAQCRRGGQRAVMCADGACGDRVGGVVRRDGRRDVPRGPQHPLRAARDGARRYGDLPDLCKAGAVPLACAVLDQGDPGTP